MKFGQGFDAILSDRALVDNIRAEVRRYLDLYEILTWIILNMSFIEHFESYKLNQIHNNNSWMQYELGIYI